MNDSKIYNRLAGGQKSTAIDIIKHIFLILLILAVSAFVYMGAPSGVSPGRIIAVLIAVFGTLFCVKFAIKQVKMSARKIEKHRELLERLTERDFYELDEQIKVNECLFGSVYLLPDHLYAPKERLLIEYRDIRKYDIYIRRQTHGQNNHKKTVGVNLEITDNEELLYSIGLKNWRECLTAGNALKDMIRDKITEKSGRHGNTW